MKIAIMGAGPGGYVAAIRAAQSGADVTLIENDHVGGTCLNWGCIPSKVMVTTANLLSKLKHADTFGISLPAPPVVDMTALMARKNQVITTQIKGIESMLAHNKVTLIKGRAQISGKNTLDVVRRDGENETVSWDKLIIATGTTPLELPDLPFDGTSVLSSNHALSLESVPSSVVIVGGGVIGCEFACILSGLGAAVTVIEASDRLLPIPGLDPDASKLLMREFKKKKIGVQVNRTVTSSDKSDDGLNITTSVSPFKENPTDKEKQPQTLSADMLLVCVGRTPNSENIGLDNIGLKPDARGWIKVNERLETDIPDVYAIGDILGPDKIMLAHMASHEGIVAAENAMGADLTADYTAVPGAIFTDPEVASVGLTEAEANERYENVQADKVMFRTIGKAHAIGEISGEAKIISEAETGRVLGAHIVGPHATDLIAEATLAVNKNLTVSDLANTIHAHPTLPEIFMEAGMKATGKALHG